MSCNGVCVQNKFRFVKNGTRQFYYAGASRCQTCMEWLSWEGIYCPCCNMKLRKKPRNKHGSVARENIEKTRVGEQMFPLIKVK